MASAGNYDLPIDFNYEVLISREVTESPESGHGEAKAGNHDLPIGS